MATFDAKGAPSDVQLILLAPNLDKRDRGTVLVSVDAVRHGNDLLVVELVPTTTA